MQAFHRILDFERQYDADLHSDNSMFERLILAWRWMRSGLCMIRSKHEGAIQLRPNHAQARIMAAMLDQAVRRQPIRIVCGKARKQGASTFVQCLFVFLVTQYEYQKAVTLAHTADATDELFSIAKFCGSGMSQIVPIRVFERFIRCDQTASHYGCHTAGGVAVGAGGTPNLLHLSEMPKWERNKEETEYNSCIAVPDTTTSIIFKEATFKGRDLFWDRFDAGCYGGGPYASVFNPWYVDPDANDGNGVELESDMTNEERAIVAQARADGIELSMGQLSWRRGKRDELGEWVFRQEYPSTPEEAVQTAKGVIFPHMRTCLVNSLPFEYKQISYENLVGGIDFGYHDATVIWSGVVFDRQLWLTHYWRGTQCLAAEQVDGLQDHTNYFCDPAATQSRNELQRAGYHRGLRCQFGTAPRTRNVGEDFVTNEINNMLAVMANRRLKVCESISRQLLIESDTYAWNEKNARPNDKRSDSVGHYDTLDSLRYLIQGVRGRLVDPQPKSLESFKERKIGRRGEGLRY